MVLSLFGVCGVAIAQPLLSLLGESPEVFSFHRIGRTTGLIAAGLVAIGVPLALSLLVLAVRLAHRQSGRRLTLALLVVLGTIAFIQVGKEVGLEQPQALTFVSFAAALGLATLWNQFSGFRTWISLLSPLPLVALGLFYYASPSGDLLRSTQAAAPVVEADEAAPDLPSVFVIVFDEFPTKGVLDADRSIDAARYPNISRFADTATWYRDHTTLSPITSAALPSLLTAQVPLTSGGTFVDHPDTLFTLLAPTHHLTVFESFTQLCGLESCTTDAPPGALVPTPSPRLSGEDREGFRETVVDLFVERVSPERADPVARDDFAEDVEPVVTVPDQAPVALDESDQRSFDEIVDDVETSRAPTRLNDFIDTIGPGGEPALHFLHLVLPHAPYHFYPDGTQYEALEEGPYAAFDGENPNDTLAAIGEHRFQFQAQYSDTQFGRILDAIEAAGLFDDSLIVFASDHGASFTTGANHRVLSDDDYDDIAYAPLLIKLPGQTVGSIDDTNAQLIDVVPTIAANLAIEVPWDVDGIALGTDPPRGNAKTFVDIRLDGLKILDQLPTEFDTALHRPDPADRWIGPSPDPDDPLARLHELGGVSDLIGERFSTTAVASATTGSIHDAPAWLNPTSGARPGVISGRVDAPRGAAIVVAVDDVIIGGSQLYDYDDTTSVFTVLVEPALFDGTGQRLDVGLLTTGGLVAVNLDNGAASN